MREATRVLIVEDDPVSRRLLEQALEPDGHVTISVRDCSEARASLHRSSYDVILLDLLLPDGDGLEVCAAIREESNVPIIIVSARGEIDDVVRGLEIGADDYIVKPFDVRTVKARVHAQIRRSTMATSDPGSRVAFGSMTVDFEQRDVFLRGSPAGLTVKEFEFLSVVARAAGRPLSKYTILDLLWGENEERSENILTVYVRKIRKKIEDDPDTPRRLVTVRGVGYRLASVD